MVKKEDQKRSKTRRKGEFFFGTNRPYLLAIVAAIILFMLVAPVRVHGDNMTPSLNDGDIIVIAKSKYYDEKLPDYGDILCFKRSFASAAEGADDAESNGDERSYRFATVYGLPGDEMTVSGDALLRNGMKVCNLTASAQGSAPSETGTDRSKGAGELISTRKVGTGEVFVLNDDKSDTMDSRSSGVNAKLDDARGKVLFRIFPINMFGAVN